MSRQDHRNYDAALLRLRAELANKTPETPVLTYLRASSVIGSFIGISGIILPSFFWWAAALFYLSLVIGVIDLCYEKSLTSLRKILFSAIIFAIFCAFTFGIVRFSAPVEVQSYWTKSDYPTGTDVSGIKWRPGLSELRVSFHNPTDRDYDDLDLNILTTEGVAQIAQVTSIACTSVAENVMSVHDSQSNVFHPLASKGAQRFRCDKLPARSTVQFVLAIANMDDLINSLQNPRAGSAIPQGLYGPKRKPRWTAVWCTYRVTFRPHSFGKQVEVGDG